MEFFTEVLPILINIALFVLLIILIIVGIRFMGLIDRMNRIADNVETKLNSVNQAVDVLSRTVNGIAGITDSIVSGVTTAIMKIFHKNKKEEESIYE